MAMARMCELGSTTVAPDARLEDLAEIVRTYNQVTERLQWSHEALGAEVARLQGELASTDAQLQRSKRLAALGEMAAGIAHEIRNPLAAIQLYATMLADDLAQSPPPDVADARSPGPSMDDSAARIVTLVRGLNAVVNDVLSFAREIDPHTVAFPVQRLLCRTVESHRPAIEAAGISVELNCRPPTLEVQADPNLLHQALLNLVRNAVEAMSTGACSESIRSAPASGQPAVLRLSAHQDRHQVVLSVRDSGPGISARDVDRIFNPFFTTRTTGTGLGLAIVHRIVDAHRGAIAVSNDSGAVFTLSLPNNGHSPETSA